LSVIRFSNAATSHEIPALEEDLSQELKDKITDMVRLVKEDV
jgi:membrane protein YdbS with pleckstrin-like domain